MFENAAPQVGVDERKRRSRALAAASKHEKRQRMGDEAFLEEKRTKEKERRRLKKEAASLQAAAAAAAAAVAAAATAQPQPQPPPPLDFFGQLNKLAELRERSLLKEDGFNTAKAILLATITAPATDSPAATASAAAFEGNAPNRMLEANLRHQQEMQAGLNAMQGMLSSMMAGMAGTAPGAAGAAGAVAGCNG
jgi:hypothetical protein